MRNNQTCNRCGSRELLNQPDGSWKCPRCADLMKPLIDPEQRETMLERLRVVSRRMMLKHDEPTFHCGHCQDTGSVVVENRKGIGYGSPCDRGNCEYWSRYRQACENRKAGTMTRFVPSDEIPI